MSGASVVSPLERLVGGEVHTPWNRATVARAWDAVGSVTAAASARDARDEAVWAASRPAVRRPVASSAVIARGVHRGADFTTVCSFWECGITTAGNAVLPSAWIER